MRVNVAAGIADYHPAGISRDLAISSRPATKTKMAIKIDSESESETSKSESSFREYRRNSSISEFSNGVVSKSKRSAVNLIALTSPI